MLARLDMLLLWSCVHLLLFASVANALQSDRQLRHRLETGLGNNVVVRRSVEGVAFTVEVIKSQSLSPRLPPDAEAISNPP